jgi:hypothetical protein
LRGGVRKLGLIDIISLIKETSKNKKIIKYPIIKNKDLLFRNNKDNTPIESVEINLLIRYIFNNAPIKGIKNNVVSIVIFIFNALRRY